MVRARSFRVAVFAAGENTLSFFLRVCVIRIHNDVKTTDDDDLLFEERVQSRTYAREKGRAHIEVFRVSL